MRIPLGESNALVRSAPSPGPGDQIVVHIFLGRTRPPFHPRREFLKPVDFLNVFALKATRCQEQKSWYSRCIPGFLDSYIDSVSAILMRGLITASGGFSGQLNVTDLTVSAAFEA